MNLATEDRRKPLSWLVPPPYGAPGASTFDQGFSPDAADQSLGDSQWWSPKADPAAFEPSRISSSGPGGMGSSGQPEASMGTRDVSKAAGTLLSRGPAQQPPPGHDESAPQYKPVTIQPPAQMAPPSARPAMAEKAAAATDPRIDQTIERIQSRQAPQVIGSRPQDFDPTTGKEKLGAKAASWGQRLALAVLSATKLAPYAQQIVRPEYSQKMDEYNAAQKTDGALLKDIESAETTKWLGLQRQEKAADLEHHADPHYGRTQVDPAYAKENLPWILPDANGQYWIDKTAETGLTKTDTSKDELIVPEGSSVYSREQGKVVLQGTPKAKELKEEEMPLGNVPQMNQALTARYQVLHPGGQLPPYFTLPTNATHGDYGRIDKALEATERAVGNKGQLDISNEMRRQTQAMMAQNHTDAVAARENKADAGLRSATHKAFTPALDSGERFNVMASNYEDAVKNHDQQAMLSLLANHLGMTMGLQKGARLNQAIISEAAKSAPWLQSIKAKFDGNGYLAGLTLSPEQMRQMVNLGRERFSQDIVKARSESKYLGATDDGPDRIAGKATINHYLALTHGDVAKAKKMATDDGWSIK